MAKPKQTRLNTFSSCQDLPPLKTTIGRIVETPIAPAVHASIPGHQ